MSERSRGAVEGRIEPVTGRSRPEASYWTTTTFSVHCAM